MDASSQAVDSPDESPYLLAGGWDAPATNSPRPPLMLVCLAFILPMNPLPFTSRDEKTGVASNAHLHAGRGADRLSIKGPTTHRRKDVTLLFPPQHCQL